MSGHFSLFKIVNFYFKSVVPTDTEVGGHACFEWKQNGLLRKGMEAWEIIYRDWWLTWFLETRTSRGELMRQTTALSLGFLIVFTTYRSLIIYYDLDEPRTTSDVSHGMGSSNVVLYLVNTGLDSHDTYSISCHVRAILRPHLTS